MHAALQKHILLPRCISHSLNVLDNEQRSSKVDFTHVIALTLQGLSAHGGLVLNARFYVNTARAYFATNLQDLVQQCAGMSWPNIAP